MKTNSIDTLFNSIRELPAEVPFSKIELFVLQQPAVVFIPKHFLLNTKIIIMTSITAIVSTVIICIGINKNDTQQPQQQALAPVSASPKTEKIDSAIQQAVITTHHPVHMEFTPAAIDSSKKKSTSTSVVIASDSSTNTVTIYSSGDNSVNISEGKGYSYSSASSGNNNTVTIYSDSNNTEVHSGNVTFDNRDCDKGDAFEQIIEDALLSDGLISSAKKYAYAITDHSFSVNGKTQPDEMRTKYLNLLLSNSCISLEGTFSFAFDKSKNTVSISTSSGD